MQAQRITVAQLHSIPEYESIRFDMRRRAVALRKARRVKVGDRVTFVFENRDTMLFQIHEVIRVEGVTDPELLQAECEVYNALLPSRHELAATLIIEPRCAASVREELTALAGIDEHSHIRLGNEVIAAEIDRGHSAEERIATVQTVRFRFDDAQRELACDCATPMWLCLDHARYTAQARLEGPTRAAICADLGVG